MEAQVQRSFSASLVSDGFRGFPEFDGLAKDFTQRNRRDEIRN